MGYFIIFTVSTLVCVILLSSGNFFNNIILKRSKKNFFELLIFGIIFLSFLALVINFFFSLNSILNLIFIIFPVLYFFLIDKSNCKSELIKILIVSTLVVILISLENTNRPDAGLYHLPYINILNENNLIIGVTNLHFRYGHTSILQYSSAIFNNIIFGSNGILILPAIFFLSLVGYFFEKINNKKSDTLIRYISFIFLSYCLINMNRYSSWGNDDFASIFFLICIIESYKLYLNFNYKDLSKLTLLCSFAFFIKTFFIISFLIPLYIFFKFYKKVRFVKILNRINFFSLIFILIWLLKNFLNSSCLLFPLEFTCFYNYDWSLTNIAINHISDISEAWAKDFPNHKQNIEFSDYISGFNWLETWLNNHFKIICKNILVLFAIIILSNFFDKIKISVMQKKFISEFLIIIFILCILWFLKFPLLRFGEGFLVSFFTFLFLYLKINNINKINFKNYKNIFISALIFIVLSKNMIRIYENYHLKYTDYPWPKKNSYSKLNKLNEYNKIMKNGEIIYYEPKNENSLCMYGKAPCAAVQINKYFFKNYDFVINKDQIFIFDSYYLTNK